MSAPASKPVIVMGMHRSGTSMVIRMLQQLGVFTGWELDANGEAVYFVRRNQAILEAHGASWGNPAPIDALLGHDGMRRRLVQTLQRDLSRAAVASYLGPWRYPRYRSLLRLGPPWGWKDPRNALLLGLWLEVFPSARVVHVVRNGMDVALSLADRETLRVQYVLGNESGTWNFLRTLATPPDGCSRPAWMFSQARLRRSKGRLARRFVQLHVPSVIDPARGFALWEEYLTRAVSAGQTAAGGVLQLRYEDVLGDPAAAARSLADHCGIEPRPGRLAEATATVDASRATHAHARAGATPLAREQRRSTLTESAHRSGWMRQLGYEVLPAAQRTER
jgi:hypothetical protein